MRRGELPGTEDFFDRPGEPAQQIHLMNRLIDQRAAAFGRPAAFERPRVVLVGSEPLYVRVGLQQPAQAARANRRREKAGRLVESMLAHDTEADTATRGGVDHLPCGRERRRDWLLDLN